MEEIKLEDVVVLIDSSRSMLRRDFKPNRIIVALNAVKNFIISKFMIDPKDRIAILSFGANTKKISPFINQEEKLIKSLKKVQISGEGGLHDGIAFALQILVEEMRKIGGKIPRIIIISDGKFNESQKLKEIVEIAQGLGIIIDSCQLGLTEDLQKNTLKRISQLTEGEYGFFTNSKAVITAGKSFASKKNIKKTSDYFSPEKKKKMPPLISEVALPLRRPTIMDIRLMMNNQGSGQERCQICHSVKSPITNADFFSEGRYCPSCGRAFHLSCASLWAKKTEYKENIFRCPFCYFLLRVPSSVLKLIDENIENSQKIQIIEDSETETTKMLLIPETEIPKINASCSYCHSIFLGDYKAFKCQRCGAYYHKPCLEKMFKEIKACRYCGSKIIFE